MQGASPQLGGIWKVLKFELKFQDSGERRDVFGPKPIGWVILTREGRAISYLEAPNRKSAKTDEERAALYRTLIAYTGRYRVDGDRFITSVDGSWNAAWTGTEPSRFFKLDGDRLSITTQWAPAPLYNNRMNRGILALEREK
jgi:hypothetical protein